MRHNLDFWINTNSNNNDQNERETSHSHPQPNHSILPRQKRSNENQSTMISDEINNLFQNSDSETESRSDSSNSFSVHNPRSSVFSNVNNYSENDTENNTEDDNSSLHRSSPGHNSISSISHKKRNLSSKDIPPELQQLFSKVCDLFNFQDNHEMMILKIKKLIQPIVPKY